LQRRKTDPFFPYLEVTDEALWGFQPIHELSLEVIKTTTERANSAKKSLNLAAPRNCLARRRERRERLL